MAYKTTQVRGDVYISHDEHIGNNLYVQSTSNFGHVNVSGWLDCAHIKDANKGMFADEDALRRAYPHPDNGWLAIVGDSLPGPVYRAYDGKWHKTDIIGGEWSGDIDYYNREVADLKERLCEAEEGILQLLDKIEGDINPVRVSRSVDRGVWSPNGKYYYKDLNPDTGYYEISYVWWNSCKYRCAKTGTTTAPRWNNPDWVMVEGNSKFEVDFAETEAIFDPDNFKTTLTIVAKMYNEDVTNDILPQDVVWTRYSEDDKGVERETSDIIWATEHVNTGKQLKLTSEDCGFYGYIPKVLRFIATVTLRDGIGTGVGTAQVEWVME